MRPLAAAFVARRRRRSRAATSARQGTNLAGDLQADADGSLSRPLIARLWVGLVADQMPRSLGARIRDDERDQEALMGIG